VGKRSPILGYNHNVRYRGLVFHVQTEDSGVASPHLFTHLFHHGVIVSTRKLDYDAGSAEESIKALMQAQHKAVLKDLRRGQFDDKIDSYLGGTPGLLPRGFEEPPERAGEAELAPSAGTVEDIAIGASTEQVLPLVLDELSAAFAVPDKTPPVRATPPAIPRATPRVAAASGPTTMAGSAAGRGNGAVDTTLKTAAPAFEISEAAEVSAEIEIQLVEEAAEEPPARPRRQTRDTETQAPVIDPTRPTLSMELDETRPTLGFDDHSRPTLGMTAEDARRAASLSDGIPAHRPSSPAVPPPPPDSRRLGDRPSTINAATLPPARPISRPPARPALTPPQVVARPLVPDDRGRRESEGVEVYSPAPPSAELPPGERPGQYAQHKKVGPRVPVEGLKQERSGGVPAPIPAGLGRPARSGSVPSAVKPATPVPSVVPREASPRGGAHTEPLRGRVPTPARLPVTSRSGATSGSGVVMTRPAVIVGVPAKTVGTVPRIRKAREDEGRGFGQGLISEKSLDEVILAYLSEDADEK
jgi:hypothetical protein